MNALPNERERRLVEWLAAGRTMEQIAGYLDILPSTTQGRVAAVRKNFRANTNAQLVAIFLRKGWIE